MRERHRKIEDEIAATYGTQVQLRSIALIVQPKLTSGRPSRGNCGYYALMWLIEGSVWETSLLWCRMAISGLQEVPRSQMCAPLTKTVGAEARLSEEMVLKQAMTHECNYYTIVAKLVEEVDWLKFDIKNATFLDCLPYDATLPKMFVDNLGQRRIPNAPSPSDPFRSFCVLSICHFMDPNHNTQVGKFVQHSTYARMRFRFMDGAITLPGFSKKEPPASDPLPPLKPDAFKLLVPCIEEDPPCLRVPRRLVEEWTASAMKDKFEAMVTELNKQYCIDGKSHKPGGLKRTADEARLDSAAGAPPPPTIGADEPNTLEEVKKKYENSNTFTLGDPKFSLTITQCMKAFVTNISDSDSILPQNTSLGLTGRGEWLLDQRATDLLNTEANVLIWEMNSDTDQVCFVSEPQLKQPLPETPLALFKILQALQLEGHTSAEFVAHAFKRQDQSPGARPTYSVQNTSKCLFRGLPSDRTKAIGLSNCWNTAKFDELRSSQALSVVVKVKHEAASNHVAPLRPLVFTKIPLRVLKGHSLRVF